MFISLLLVFEISPNIELCFSMSNSCVSNSTSLFLGSCLEKFFFVKARLLLCKWKLFKLLFFNDVLNILSWLFSTDCTKSLENPVDKAATDGLLTHIDAILLECISKDLKVQFNSFLLLLLPFLGKNCVFTVIIGLTCKNFQE